MMREPVCIVLNEREPDKLKVAEALEARLAYDNITSSRLSIGPDIIELVLARSPKILVLDYLLGDYSTGLDILSAIQSLEPAARPRVFFLTDEPSVPVAVTALKLGSIDYLEIDNPDSVNKLAREIKSILRDEKSAARRPPRIAESLSDLIGESEFSSRLIKAARNAAQKKPCIILISGEEGSGVSTLAHAVAQAYENDNFTQTVDLRFYAGKIENLTGLREGLKSDPALGRNMNLIAENCGEDAGELLQFISSHRDRIWPAGEFGHGSVLIVCARDQQTVNGWSNLLKPEILRIPSLAERKEDFPALVQQFTREAEEISGKKIKPVPADVIQWLSELNWVANIKQLRACTINALLTNLSFPAELRDLLQENHDLWSSNENPDGETEIDPFTAARALEMNGMNYRIAAARLGCSISRLNQIIRSS